MTLKAGTKLTPVAGSYIILLDPTPEKSEGGVYIPDSAQGKDDDPFRQFGTILAAGASVVDKHGNTQRPEFEKGERVIVMPGGQIPLPHDSRRLCVVSFTAVLCRVGGDWVGEGINYCTVPNI